MVQSVSCLTLSDFIDDIEDFLEEEKRAESDSMYGDDSPISILSGSPERERELDSEEGFSDMYKRNFAITLEETEVQTEPNR